MTRDRFLTYQRQDSQRKRAIWRVLDHSEDEEDELLRLVQRRLDQWTLSHGAARLRCLLGPTTRQDPVGFCLQRMDWEQATGSLLQEAGFDDATLRETREIRQVCSVAADIVRPTSNAGAQSTAPATAIVPAGSLGALRDGYPIGPMPALQIEVCEQAIGSGAKTVMFDLAGSQVCGERTNHEGIIEESLEAFNYTDYLIRRPEGDFVMIRSISHWREDCGWCEARQVATEEAAKWLVFGKFAVPDDLASLADVHRFPACADRTWDNQPTIASTSANTIGQLANRSVEPSEEMRHRYQDPSNYWRNVWLYELRELGMTMEEIVRKLAERGKDFYEIYEHNAIRSALKSIAYHHGWPQLQGKPGRRKGGR